MSKSRKEFFVCLAIGTGVTALNVFSEWTGTAQLPSGLGWLDTAVQALFTGLLLWAISGLFRKFGIAAN